MLLLQNIVLWYILYHSKLKCLSVSVTASPSLIKARSFPYIAVLVAPLRYFLSSTLLRQALSYAHKKFMESFYEIHKKVPKKYIKRT